MRTSKSELASEVRSKDHNTRVDSLFLGFSSVRIVCLKVVSTILIRLLVSDRNLRVGLKGNCSYE